MHKKDVISIDYLEEPARFADLINGYVYQGKELIKPEDIRELNRSVTKISKNDKELNRFRAQVITADIVREVYVNMAVAIVALENQADIHYAMPVRVMNLESANYQRQWRKKRKYHAEAKDLSGAEFLSGFSKEDRLVPTFTIVVYFGKKPWDGPTSMKEMMELERYPQELREMVEDYHIHLLEVRKYQKLDDFHTDLQYVFGFLLNEESMDGLSAYVQKHKEVFENLSEDAFDMISVMSHSEKLSEYKQLYLQEDGGTNMCKAIEDMIEKEVIRIFLELHQEMGLSRELILQKIRERFNLSEEEANAKIQLYGNE